MKRKLRKPQCTTRPPEAGPLSAEKPALVLATTSRDKIREIQKVLGKTRFSFLSLSQFTEIKQAKETGKTFKENAATKARHVARKTGLPALADDSGICVRALNGAPGIRSSRWAGEKATDADRNNLMLEKLKNVPRGKRSAYYECAIAVAVPESKTRGEKVYTVDAKCRGIISSNPQGKNGFGYDPLFYVPAHKRTMAQLPLKTKNKISHRGKALQKMKKKLAKIFSELS